MHEATKLTAQLALVLITYTHRDSSSRLTVGLVHSRLSTNYLLPTPRFVLVHELEAPGRLAVGAPDPQGRVHAALLG
eukprot:scaffold29606_cov52-Phaeocystis_antarctica.AAC.1